jgi:hypothetical protein
MVEKHDRKKPLERHGYRWEDISIDLKYIGWEGVDSNDLPQNRYKWWAVLKAVRKLGFCKI